MPPLRLSLISCLHVLQISQFYPYTYIAIPFGHKTVYTPAMEYDEPNIPEPEDGYLAGQLLIATPQLGQSFFAKTVIYLCVHNKEGAMGLIINKPMREAESSHLVEHFALNTAPEDFDYPVYQGGPVEPQRGFLLHSNDYCNKGTVMVDNHFSVTSNVDILEAMADGSGPHEVLLALGCAGWAPRQLEQEIEQNSWFSVPATKSLVFDAVDSSKWMLASKSIGVDPYMFADHAGHA